MHQQSLLERSATNIGRPFDGQLLLFYESVVLGIAAGRKAATRANTKQRLSAPPPPPSHTRYTPGNLLEKTLFDTANKGAASEIARMRHRRRWPASEKVSIVCACVCVLAVAAAAASLTLANDNNDDDDVARCFTNRLSFCLSISHARAWSRSQLASAHRQQWQLWRCQPLGNASDNCGAERLFVIKSAPAHAPITDAQSATPLATACHE